MTKCEKPESGIRHYSFVISFRVQLLPLDLSRAAPEVQRLDRPQIARQACFCGTNSEPRDPRCLRNAKLGSEDPTTADNSAGNFLDARARHNIARVKSPYPQLG
jgi:hypothetical protein